MKEKRKKPATNRRAKHKAPALAVAAFLTAVLVMAGCSGGEEAGRYETASRIYEVNNRLNECLKKTTGFLEAVASIDIEGNIDVFSGFASAVESSRAAVEEARSVLGEMEAIEFSGSTEELGELVAAYTEEAAAALDEIASAISYVEELNESFEPLRDVRKEIGEMEMVEIKDDYTIAVERAGMILYTQDEVIETIREISAPVCMLHFSQALTERVKEFYGNIEAFIIEAGTGTVPGAEEEGTGGPSGSQLYEMAMEELPGLLKINNLDEKAAVMEELLFDYLVRYRPETED